MAARCSVFHHGVYYSILSQGGGDDDVELQDRLLERDARSEPGDVQRTAPERRTGRVRRREDQRSPSPVQAVGKRGTDATRQWSAA